MSEQSSNAAPAQSNINAGGGGSDAGASSTPPQSLSDRLNADSGSQDNAQSQQEGSQDANQSLSDKLNNDQGVPEDQQGQEGEEGKQEGEENQEQEGAPEKYEQFKLPETLVRNEEFENKFSDTARKYNLSQDAAQEFVDMHAEIVAETTKAGQEAADKAFMDAVQDLKERQKTEVKDMGETVTKAFKLISAFEAPPEAKQELRDLFAKNEYLGNHPTLLNFLAWASNNKIGEDSFPDGKGERGLSREQQEKKAAKAWFPNRPDLQK